MASFWDQAALRLLSKIGPSFTADLACDAGEADKSGEDRAAAFREARRTAEKHAYLAIELTDCFVEARTKRYPDATDARPLDHAALAIVAEDAGWIILLERADRVRWCQAAFFLAEAFFDARRDRWAKQRDAWRLLHLTHEFRDYDVEERWKRRKEFMAEFNAQDGPT